MRKRRTLVVGLCALASLLLLGGTAVAFALYFLHKFSPGPPRNDFPPAASDLAPQQQDVEQFSRPVFDRAVALADARQ